MHAIRTIISAQNTNNNNQFQLDINRNAFSPFNQCPCGICAFLFCKVAKLPIHLILAYFDAKQLSLEQISDSIGYSIQTKYFTYSKKESELYAVAVALESKGIVAWPKVVLAI